MKHLRTLTLLLLFVSTLLQLPAQKIDVSALMTHHVPTCMDISLNCMLLVPAYYNGGQMDTLTALLDYWEKSCGSSEPLLRVKILLAIKNRSFNESLYDCSVLRMIDHYRQLAEGPSRSYYYEFRTPDLNTKEFNSFTLKLAGELKNRALSPLELFFADLYSNNYSKIFLRLNGVEFAGTLLQRCYLADIHESQGKTEGHWAFYAGTWYPFGNLNLVGTHPVIGVKLGIKIRKLIADLSLNLKFLNSAHSYQVFKDDSLYDTRHFLGAYLGMDVGYEIFRHKKHELDLIGGIGYEGFDAIEDMKTKYSDKATVSLSSLNLNLGLGYRFYITSTTYIGLQGRYNFVNFLNHGGTNLSGNTMEFYILIGNSGNSYKEMHLRMLDVTQ